MTIREYFRKGPGLNLLPLLIAALAARMIPHIPNFTPLEAMALFAGATIPRRYALTFILVVRLVSDAAIGFYAPIMMLFVALGTGANVLTGYVFCREKRGMKTVAAASFFGATAFFILSNFGYWLSATTYPLTPQGLMECYVAALPFFVNTLGSHLLYSSLLFGASRLICARSLTSREAS